MLFRKERWQNGCILAVKRESKRGHFCDKKKKKDLGHLRLQIRRKSKNRALVLVKLTPFTSDRGTKRKGSVEKKRTGRSASVVKKRAKLP